MSAATHDDRDQAFGRSGHLSTLGADRYLYGDLPASLTRDVDDHAQHCAECRDWLAALRAIDAAHPLPAAPPWEDAGANVLSLAPPARRRRWLPAAAAAVALAAAALLVALPSASEPDDGYTTKGNAFEFEAFVSARTPDASDPRVDSGDTIRPGDRVGFRFQAHRAGFLAVIGIDTVGATYVAYPSDADTAQPIAVSAAPSPLPAALEFDANGHHERIIALLCDTAVPVAALTTRLANVSQTLAAETPVATLDPRCAQRELILRKTPHAGSP